MSGLHYLIIYQILQIEKALAYWQVAFFEWVYIMYDYKVFLHLSRWLQIQLFEFRRIFSCIFFKYLIKI